MDISIAYKSLTKKLTDWLASVGEMTPNLILTVLVLVAFWYIAKGVQKGANRGFSKAGMNPAARGLLATLLRIVVVGGGIAIALGILQLDKALASILAGAGVVGLALGFAFQDLAANLISGVGLALNREKPFRIGDIIETNDEFGKVISVDLRTSTMRTLDGKIVVIPNKQIYQNKVINHSVTGCRRVELACGISYGEDLKHVRDVVLKVLQELSPDGQRSAKPDDPAPSAPEVLFGEFGDSSINFTARFWVPYETQGGFLKKKSDAVMAIKAAFDEADIMIPFPIRTLDFGIKGGEKLRSQLGVKED